MYDVGFMRLPSLRSVLSSPLQVVLAILALGACSPYDVARAALAAGRHAPPGKPLPAEGSTALAEKDAALQNAWFELNLIQAYRKVGHRNPQCDAAAEAFLRESAPSFLGLAPEGTEDLRSRATAILDAG